MLNCSNKYELLPSVKRFFLLLWKTWDRSLAQRTRFSELGKAPRNIQIYTGSEILQQNILTLLKNTNICANLHAIIKFLSWPCDIITFPLCHKYTIKDLRPKSILCWQSAFKHFQLAWLNYINWMSFKTDLSRVRCQADEKESVWDRLTVLLKLDFCLVFFLRKDISSTEQSLCC